MHHYHRLLHVGVRPQDRLNLAKFNTKPAELNLEIHATQELNRAVRQIPRQIPRSVQSRARPGTKRIGNKLLRRQFRTVQVTAGQSITADEQFARHTDRHRLHAFIDNMEARVSNRLAEDNPRARTDATRSRPDGRFGRAVHVPDFAIERGQLFCEVRWERFATAENLAQRFPVPPGLQQQPPCDGCRLHDRRATTGQQMRQHNSIRRHVATGNHNLRPCRQRQP